LQTTHWKDISKKLPPLVIKDNFIWKRQGSNYMYADNIKAAFVNYLQETVWVTITYVPQHSTKKRIPSPTVFPLLENSEEAVSKQDAFLVGTRSPAINYSYVDKLVDAGEEASIRLPATRGEEVKGDNGYTARQANRNRSSNRVGTDPDAKLTSTFSADMLGDVSLPF
jgi:hypothetical protein